MAQAVAGLLPRRPVFDPGSVHVKFMVEWNWDRFFFRDFRVTLLIIGGLVWRSG
jgi:hypothetical protein